MGSMDQQFDYERARSIGLDHHTAQSRAYNAEMLRQQFAKEMAQKQQVGLPVQPVPPTFHVPTASSYRPAYDSQGSTEPMSWGHLLTFCILAGVVVFAIMQGTTATDAKVDENAIIAATRARYAEARANGKPLTPQMLITINAWHAKRVQEGWGSTCEHPVYSGATYSSYTYQDVNVDLTEHCETNFGDQPAGFRHESIGLWRDTRAVPWRVSAFSTGPVSSNIEDVH